jgi:hypothetical protein
VPVRPAARGARQPAAHQRHRCEARRLLIGTESPATPRWRHWSPPTCSVSTAARRDGRIGRENWIEQSQILSRGGDTAFSRDYDRRARGEPVPLRPAKLADAIREHSGKASGDAPPPAKTDLAALRSVRSAAYQNPEPGRRPPSAPPRRAR